MQSFCEVKHINALYDMVIVFYIIMNGQEKTFYIPTTARQVFLFSVQYNYQQLFYTISSVNGYVNKHNVNNQKGLSKNLGPLQTFNDAIRNNSCIIQNN